MVYAPYFKIGAGDEVGKLVRAGKLKGDQMKYTLSDYIIALVGIVVVIIPQVLAHYIFNFIDYIKGGDKDEYSIKMD